MKDPDRDYPAATNHLYPNLLTMMAGGLVNFITNRLGIILHTDEYQPLPTHSTVDHLYGETEGPGYKPGGCYLENTRFIPLIQGGFILTADPVVWSDADFDAASATVFTVEHGILVTHITFEKTLHPGPGRELRLDWPEGAIACMMSREVLR